MPQKTNSNHSLPPKNGVNEGGREGGKEGRREETYLEGAGN